MRSSLRISPQLKDRVTVSSIMLDVIVALLPALGVSVYIFGPRVLALCGVSMLTCVISEKVFCLVARRRSSLRDMSACVTGLLLAMTLPVTAPYWAVVLGGVFAIVVVKQLYGGLGRNFMNPALAGRMLLLSFPRMMTTWVPALEWVGVTGEIDTVSAATPMAYLHNGTLPPQALDQMFLGQRGGAIGEVACYMLLLGGLYLWGRRVISWRIPVTFIGSVALLTYLFPVGGVEPVQWMLYQLLSGGLLLGAIFMACDYTTSPVTPRGQLLFGLGCGCLTVMLRYFGSYPDGVGFAILTMNCFVWLLDRLGQPRRFGIRTFQAPLAWAKGQLVKLAKALPSLPKMPRQPAKEEKAPDSEQAKTVWKDRLMLWGRCAGSVAGMVLVCALMIYGVNQATEGIIRQRQFQEEQALLVQVMPRANIITQTPYTAEGALSITAGYSDSELEGYCIEIETQGFGGVITMVVGVNLNGQVTGVAVTNHSEQALTGGQATQQTYLRRYIGRSGTINLDGTGNSVDAISGATESCRAITVGVNKALYIASQIKEGSFDYEDQGDNV